MGFQRTVPKNAEELFVYLGKIHENRSHVSSIKVNHNDAHLEIDLDWTANKMGGYPDVYLPMKRGRLGEAKIAIERMLKQSEAGFSPSRADAQAIFDMIDPHGS